MKESKYTDDRITQLQSYLERLAQGESLDSVRTDFVQHFQTVEPTEIMKAEQELMRRGTPLTTVQKLCDLHSALFHGSTCTEQAAARPAAPAPSPAAAGPAVSPSTGLAYTDREEAARRLAGLTGHPLRMFSQENRALELLLKQAQKAITNLAVTPELLIRLRDIAIHYAKKGDLLYPLLKVNYGITGPSDVMWTVDDEIRDELSRLIKAQLQDESWYDQLGRVLKRAGEMIYKEDNILLPICAVTFTEQEWYGIYHDAKDYDCAFCLPREVWPAAEAAAETATAAAPQPAPAAPLTADSEIYMPGGHMTVAQLTALLNTLPLEISFVDADNINRFFNERHKVFKRPHMAIDREVFSCHPPKIEPMVRRIIDSFRAGTRDKVPVWMERNGRSMLVTYMAVRDRNHNYVGTMELIQDMEFAKEHFQAVNAARPLQTNPQDLY